MGKIYAAKINHMTNPMGFLMVILLSLVFSILVAIVFRKKDLF